MGKTITCRQVFRDEFRVKNLGLSYESPELFVEPATFCTVPLFWVIFESTAALYSIALVFYGLGDMSFNAMWLTLLSNWTLILTAACTVTHFCAVAIHYGVQLAIRPTPLRYSKMPLLFKVDWVLQNIQFPFTFIVTILRWAVQIEVPEPLVIEVTLSGLSLAYSILNQIVWNIPWRLLHVYQPMIVGVAYAVFSGVYWVLGGIYPNGRRYDLPTIDFDSNQPLAIGILFVFVFTIVFAFLFSGLLTRLIGWFRTTFLPDSPIYMRGVDYSLITDENATKYHHNSDIIDQL